MPLGTASFQSESVALTYEPFFGLNEKPFSLSAESRFVFNSPSHGATREGLLAGIRRREGLLVLTGEIGTGKTTLCRTVLRDLGRNTYSSIVADPFASREDLLKMLLIDFGVVSIEQLTGGSLRGASRTELGYLLSGFLDSLTPDVFAVVMFDEAQNLTLPLIEETRILFDTFGAAGRLQIVFVGQPELHAKLKLPEMRQVDQRVCGYHRLAPMSRDAVSGYIQHRLQVAGCHRDRLLFPPAIVEALHQRSGGVPRLINRVCDRALHIAHERKASAVDREILDTALIEVGAVTLSPTWDSIVFAQTPAPVAAAAASAVRTAPRGEEQTFDTQIDQWVSQDLATPSRTLTRLPAAAVADAPRAAAKTPAKTAPRRSAPRPAPIDWPRDRSETYIRRFLRMWAKRVAIVGAVFVAINMAVVGANVLWETRTPAEAAEAPVSVAPAVAQPEPTAAPPVTELPAAEAPATDAPMPAAAASAAVAGEYFVAVGLFASTERADQLVEELTQAGLPAMQRPFQLRRQDVQQIVLGPFFSRADAVSDLRRLQALGGYADASVITN